MSWAERWKGKDRGLISCWETGRLKSKSDPELAKKAENGELPVLGWKGGTNQKLRKNFKYGTLFYLAKWQGLRGDDLDIHLDKEVELICSKTEMKVIFTPDFEKYSNA